MDAVVVTHNSEQDLRGLLACRPVARAFERIVVVDNASSDRSRQVARGAGADVVAHAENHGFGAAANLGARRTSGDFFFLLNPDIRFSSADISDRLLENFADSRVALVGPRLVLPDGRTQDSAREVPTPLTLLRRRWGNRPYGAIVSTVRREVPWVVGACVVVRRSAFDSVGGFDTRFFLYFEDVDLCVRLAAVGRSVLFDPTVNVAHRHRAASRTRLLSWATRQHITSAARFFAYHPRFMMSATTH